ncbi:MAG TPA: hypothetical protein VF807_14650 [Ktedonobacterales bacterium]
MTTDAVTRPRSLSAWRTQWPEWAGYLTAAWSLAYGLLGLFWALGGPGFPFGHGHDAAAIESILANVQVRSAAPVIAGLGIGGALIALVMVRAWGRGALRTGLLAFAWALALALLVIIPDRRVLLAVAYVPVFIIGAPFHYPPVSFFAAIPWPVINQAILIIGGVAWAATALAYQRVTAGACAHCGRTDQQAGWMTPPAVARWGWWAVAVAIACPVLYAVPRYAWALGIPLGISEGFLREGQRTNLWIAGAGLATVAVGGAILTLGLAQKWGEVFPRWMLGLAGKRVPPALAIVPALLIADFVTSAGLEEIRALGLASEIPIEVTWTTLGPTLLWPLWGAALAVATYAYYLRRRGQCAFCGRG